MHVIKPQVLGLATRPIEYRKRFGLCITAMLHVPFDQGAQGHLWGEQSMWDFLGREMVEPLIDEGVAKLTAEFMVHGNAYPPAPPAAGVAVRARLGNVSKTLLVFGDRHWQGRRLSDPLPFEQMPLDWAHAYGGADFDINPWGKGREPAQGVWPLPNIELPHSPLHAPEQTVVPAGFGRLDAMHPARAAFRGTYDATYLKEHSPGFAPDLDWKYFNMAPADQWLSVPLRGDESYELDHLHPQRPHIEGRLPGLHPRVFANYLMRDGGHKLREVPMRATTVWFFPHAERLVLLFHGLADVGTDDGSDVLDLTCAVERIDDTPRSDAYYARVVAQRADPQMGSIHALRDSDLLPPGLDTSDPATQEAEAAFAFEGLHAEAQYRRAEADVALAREEVRAMGRDPDALGIVMPPREERPPPEQLAAYMEKKLKEAELQQWHALDDALRLVEKGIKEQEARGVPLADLQHRGPPAFRAEQELGQFRRAAEGERRSFHPEAVYPQLLQKQAVEAFGYLQAAHTQPPAHAMPEAARATLRSEMSRAMAIGMRSFRGMDFTGADFSGLDLRGIDLRGAWLESVDFAKANLSGADLSHAVLAHGDLREVVAVKSVFAGANLGRSRLGAGVFDDADFTGATLDGCELAGAQFRRAQFASASLLEVRWGPSDWTGAQAVGQLFHRSDLQAVTLVQADLSGANFVECKMRGCDMREAVLAQATFLTCELDGARWNHARAEGVVVVKDCSLRSVDLSNAMMKGANFGGADLARARLVGATVDGANFGESQMAGSDWRLASAKGAMLRKCGLAGAQLAGADFSNAMLQHADLRGADLRRSNLFQADLSRVRLDADVRLDGALLRRARTWPRLTPEQHAAAPWP